jgi:hypothetical protein
VSIPDVPGDVCERRRRHRIQDTPHFEAAATSQAAGHMI